MEDNIFDKVHEVDLEKTMKESYIDYAMSVIASRALPDVRDGLKPVLLLLGHCPKRTNYHPDQFSCQKPSMFYQRISHMIKCLF